MLLACPIDRRVHGFCNGLLSEFETGSHLICYVERVLVRSRIDLIRTNSPARAGGSAGTPVRECWPDWGRGVSDPHRGREGPSVATSRPPPPPTAATGSPISFQQYLAGSPPLNSRGRSGGTSHEENKSRLQKCDLYPDSGHGLRV